MLRQSRFIPVGTVGRALEELEAPIGDVGNALFSLWQEVQPEGALPYRDQFPSSVLAEIMPNLYFIEALDEGQDFTARFFGSTLVELMGIDFTGLTFADVPEEQRWRAEVFKIAMERKAPLFYLFDLGSVGKPHYKTANTILPVLDRDGQFNLLMCASEVVEKTLDIDANA